MTTYLALINWASAIKDSPKRLDAARKSLADMRGSFKSIFMTMGAHDLAAIYEAPDDAVAARFTLMLGQTGNIRTTTLKAFPEQAYREIVNSL